MPVLKQAPQKGKPYKGSGLKPGDRVKMVNCMEATLPKYADKVWTVRSECWLLGHGAEVVKLEGRPGFFATRYLKKVEGGLP